MKKNTSLFISIIKSLFTRLTSVFITLTLITLVYINWYYPFVIVGPELLNNPSFNQEFSYWEKTGRPESITIENQNIVKLNLTNPQSNTSLTQIISDPFRFKFLKLSGQIKTEEINPGKKDWQKARLVLSSYDENGNWLPAPQNVARFIGTNKWQLYSKVFRITPTAKQLRVSAQLPHATGTMWIKNLSLKEVHEKRSAIYYKFGFIIVWSVFLTSLLLPYIINPYTWIWRLMVAACLFTVLLGNLALGEQKIEFQKSSIHFLQKMIQPQEERGSVASSDIKDQRNQTHYGRQWERVLVVIFKGGHFIFFALLAFVLPLAIEFKKRRTLIPDLFMLAATTELMQNFIDGRIPLFQDLFINLSGVIVGLFLATIGLRVRKNRLIV